MTSGQAAPDILTQWLAETLKGLPPERQEAFQAAIEAEAHAEAPPGPAVSEPLLSPQAVAARLSVTPWAVREWIRQGRLRAVRVAGKLLRVPESALAEVVEPVTPEGKRYRRPPSDSAIPNEEDDVRGGCAATYAHTITAL